MFQFLRDQSVARLRKKLDRAGLQMSVPQDPRQAQRLALGYAGDYLVTANCATIFLGTPEEHARAMLTAAPAVQDMPLLVAMRPSAELDHLVAERKAGGAEIVEINLDPAAGIKQRVNPFLLLKGEHISGPERRQHIDSILTLLMPDRRGPDGFVTTRARQLLMAFAVLYDALPDLQRLGIETDFDSTAVSTPTLHGLAQLVRTHAVPNPTAFIRKCSEIISSEQVLASNDPAFATIKSSVNLVHIERFLDLPSMPTLLDQMMAAIDAALTPFQDPYGRMAELTAANDLAIDIFGRCLPDPTQAVTPSTVIIRLGADENTNWLASYLVEGLLSARFWAHSNAYCAMAPHAYGGGMACFLDASMIMGNTTTAVVHAARARVCRDAFAFFSSQSQLRDLFDRAPARAQTLRSVCGHTMKLNAAEEQETAWHARHGRLHLPKWLLKEAKKYAGSRGQLFSRGGLFAPMELRQTDFGFSLLNRLKPGL